jgi:hypothetical protein
MFAVLVSSLGRKREEREERQKGREGRRHQIIIS